MAEGQTVGDALTQALGVLANNAATAPNGSEALRYAQAVNEIAEARAWISFGAQPHGGKARAL